MRTAWTLTALLVIASSASGQSSNQYLRLQGLPQHGYIEIPSDVLLDVTTGIYLRVRDDGRGFDIAGQTDGYGLRGMRARAEQVSGELSVHSGPSSGTTVELEVPP